MLNAYVGNNNYCEGIAPETDVKLAGNQHTLCAYVKYILTEHTR